MALDTNIAQYDAPEKDLYEIGEIPPMGYVPKQMYAWTIRKERQREGIERAKAVGVYKGRKRTVDAEQVCSLRKQGLGATDIATKLGIGRASVYRALKDDDVVSTS